MKTIHQEVTIGIIINLFMIVFTSFEVVDCFYNENYKLALLYTVCALILMNRELYMRKYRWKYV
jgi:hypothetical protein